MLNILNIFMLCITSFVLIHTGIHMYTPICLSNYAFVMQDNVKVE